MRLKLTLIGEKLEVFSVLSLNVVKIKYRYFSSSFNFDKFRLILNVPCLHFKSRHLQPPVNGHSHVVMVRGRSHIT